MAEKCGGCQYTGMPYAKQLKKKQAYINGLLGRFTVPQKIIGMADPLHYRNKVHHVFGYDKTVGVKSGCYQQGTHSIVNVDHCMIEDEQSQEIIRTVRKLCRSFKIRTYDEDTGHGLLRHVLVRRGFRTGEIMVVLVLASQVLPGKNDFIRALRDAHPQITTIVLNVNNRQTSMVLGDFEKPVYGPGFIRDELCGCRFRISAKSFYQVNPVQTEVLYRTAIGYAELTGKETVIDAYCGIGTIGLCAAAQAGKVIGVELNPDAVRDAVINAKENHIENAQFIRDDATKWISGYKGSADVVFMDPPRSGSTQQFIKAVAGLAPKRVVYVSCGPETLARDLQWFERYGYRVKKIQPVDMFPFTEHVETVCLLSKKCPV